MISRSAAPDIQSYPRHFTDSCAHLKEEDGGTETHEDAGG